MHFGHLSVINTMLYRCERVYVIFYHDEQIERDIKTNDKFDYPISQRIADARAILCNPRISVLELEIPNNITFPDDKELIKEQIHIEGNLDVQYIGLEEEHVYKDHIYADTYECAGIYTIETEEGIQKNLHSKDIRNNLTHHKTYIPRLIRDKIDNFFKRKSADNFINSKDANQS